MLQTKNALRDELLTLSKKRDIIDNLIKSYSEVLEAELGSTKAGLELNLIDPEGYPLAEINHLSCRNSRKQINILQNDRKELTKLMEEKLFKFHAIIKQMNDENSLAQNKSTSAKKSKNKPILEVTDVTSGSTPAFESGLQKGDKIIKIGDIQSENFLGLNQIASLVKTNQNKQLTIALLRNSDVIQFTSITPRVWGGKGRGYFGLLGCALNPL